MAKRQALSKKTRFEVFKRDEFVCQRDYFASVKRFVEHLGAPFCIEAMDIALARVHTGHGSFRYFCGICWNEIRRVEATS